MHMLIAVAYLAVFIIPFAIWGYRDSFTHAKTWSFIFGVAGLWLAFLTLKVIAAVLGIEVT